MHNSLKDFQINKIDKFYQDHKETIKVLGVDKNKYIELQDKASDLFTELFIILMEFILKGEFAKLQTNDNDLEKTLEDLKKSLFSITTDIMPSNSDENSYATKWNQNFLNQFKYIRNAFEAILYFNSICLNTSHKKYIKPKTIMEQDPIIPKEGREQDMKDALNNVIKLTYYDFEFHKSGDLEYLIKRLCEIIYLFEDGEKPFYKLALEKARFLLKKVLMCYEKEDRTKFSVFIKDETVKCADLIKETNLSKRTKMLCELISIYEKDKLDDDNLNELHRLKKNFSRLNLKSIENYIEVKILKDKISLQSDLDDMIKSIEQIKEIGETLGKSSQDDSSFNSFVVNINKVFIFNNLISLSDEFLETINQTTEHFNQELDKKVKKVYDIVKSVISQIEENTELKNIENYFTYYKYSMFLCNYYKYQILRESKENTQHIYKKIKEVTQKSSNLFYKFNEKFQKYRLKLEESFVGDGENQAFIYSSINLPFNYSRQQALIDK